MSKIAIFWFRRDLRLEDNAGLFHALQSGFKVLPLFIFDREILDQLPSRKDARVEFILQAIGDLQSQLVEMGSSMDVRIGSPVEVWGQLLKDYEVEAVYTNRDYEPYALARDAAVRELLAEQQIDLFDFKDQVIFERDEVVKDDGKPYTVFTPYSRKWKAKLESKVVETDGKPLSFYLQSYPTEKHFDAFLPLSKEIPGLSDLGFEPAGISFPPQEVPRARIKSYQEKRNFPAIEGTSKLGVHFRFGTISIRKKARNAAGLSSVYLSELIWRDFYAMILHHFPHVTEGPFRKKYEAIEWRNNPEEFTAWTEGKTGYPIVDAGMRELNTTGFMHNRVRMITASFLSKHLLINWQWGEAYFAEKLLDFDLASNNGGWQWAAGCGTDAAPYFRIFNPYTQQEKFDKGMRYVRQWVPEYGTPAYPEPIVDHKEARERCLVVYKEGLERAE
jgi:deoxyribodipyrimidine photo-lyase